MNSRRPMILFQLQSPGLETKSDSAHETAHVTLRSLSVIVVGFTRILLPVGVLAKSTTRLIGRLLPFLKRYRDRRSAVFSTSFAKIEFERSNNGHRQFW